MTERWVPPHYVGACEPGAPEEVLELIERFGGYMADKKVAVMVPCQQREAMRFMMGAQGKGARVAHKDDADALCVLSPVNFANHIKTVARKADKRYVKMKRAKKV